MGMLFPTASLILNQSTWFGTLRREMTAPRSRFSKRLRRRTENASASRGEGVSEGERPQVDHACLRLRLRRRAAAT